MFIGKPICLIARGLITVICLSCLVDKKIDRIEKIKLIVMTGVMDAILISLQEGKNEKILYLFC